MEKLKKVETFTRAQAAFGPWRSWTRSQHVAYGLARGVPYVVMERCSNDAPPWHGITRALVQLGAWPTPAPAEEPRSWWARVFGPKKTEDPRDVLYKLTREHQAEVEALVVWVRKEPRGKRPRPCKSAPAAPVTATG